jgi:hypothetical protein
MSQTAQVKVELTSEAKLAAIEDYSRRTAEATERTSKLRGEMSKLGEMGKLGAVFGAAGLTVEALSERFNEAKSAAAVMAQEIARASGRVGVSAEAYQVLGITLKNAGGDAADLTVALGHLRSSLGEAIKDTDSGPAKALRQLGISAADLSKLRPEQSLEKLSKALDAIENPAVRASLAQDLLGRGASTVTPILDRLATDGYGNLREEISRTAGIMSGEMAQALDETARRTEDAGHRMAVAFAPFQLRAAETKASIAELFAEIAGSPISKVAGGVAIGGLVAGGATAAAAAAGGLGSASAWGIVAGAMVAKAAATAAPAWMGIGLLIAAGFAGAAVVKGMEQKALAEQELRADFLNQPIDRANKLRTQLQEVRDPEMAARIQQEAARRARITFQQAGETPDAEMKANLEVASRIYSSIAKSAREQSQAIAAGNKLLDANLASQREAEETAAALAARDKEAYDWTRKEGEAMAKQTEEAQRRLDLSRLDPEQRRLFLETERTDLLQKQADFQGTAYEKEKLGIETAAKLVAINTELEATGKEIAANNEKSAKAKADEAEAAQKGYEWQLKQRLLQQEAGIDKDVRDMAGQNARNQADFRLTAEEKRKLNIAALEAERDYLTGSAKDLRKNGGDEENRRAQQYEDRALDLTKQIETEKAGTPQTAMEGLEAGLTKIQDRWGTLSQQISSGVQSIGDAITGSLAGGMEQLLGTTEYWSKQLGSIAGPIMGAVTQAISKMFAEWIVGRAAAAVKNILFSTQEGEADTAAKAPGAMFSSISSFGVAAALGIAGFLAAKALTGGFFEGGFTGLGNPRDPAGVVHRGEFVIPHDVTKMVGPGALASLVESVRNPSQSFEVPAALAPQMVSVPAQSAGQKSEDDAWVPKERTLFVDHRDQDMIDRLTSDPRFTTKVRHIGRNNPGDFGSAT